MIGDDWGWGLYGGVKREKESCTLFKALMKETEFWKLWNNSIFHFTETRRYQEVEKDSKWNAKKILGRKFEEGENVWKWVREGGRRGRIRDGRGIKVRSTFVRFLYFQFCRAKEMEWKGKAKCEMWGRLGNVRLRGKKRRWRGRDVKRCETWGEWEVGHVRLRFGIRIRSEEEERVGMWGWRWLRSSPPPGEERGCQTQLL